MHKNRKRNRLQGFDYSSNALYFVTPVVKDRICFFGRIVNNEMQLNELGEIVERQWFWLAEQYSYVILHSFQIMPDHVHGIIEINAINVGTGRNLSGNTENDANRTGRDLSMNNDRDHDGDRTGRDLSLQKIKSLSELMGAFKMTSSKQIRLLHSAGSACDPNLPEPSTFKWQRSFHDHIIRDQNAYERISNYIETNPQLWQDDRFFP